MIRTPVIIRCQKAFTLSKFEGQHHPRHVGVRELLELLQRGMFGSRRLFTLLTPSAVGASSERLSDAEAVGENAAPTLRACRHMPV